VRKSPTRPEHTEWATFLVDKKLLTQLDELAIKEDRSRSAVIRQLLLRALANQEKQV